MNDKHKQPVSLCHYAHVRPALVCFPGVFAVLLLFVETAETGRIAAPPHCICFLSLIDEITVYSQTAPDVVSGARDCWNTHSEPTEAGGKYRHSRESACSAVWDEMLRKWKKKIVNSIKKWDFWFCWKATLFTFRHALWDISLLLSELKLSTHQQDWVTVQAHSTEYNENDSVVYTIIFHYINWFYSWHYVPFCDHSKHHTLFFLSDNWT